MIEPLGFAIMFSIIGFIVIYGKQLRNDFEYVFESFEYILLISAPLIVGASLVVGYATKNYFLIAYFASIMGWFIFWIFVKKWGSQEEEDSRRVRLARPFTIGMFCGFLVIGLLLFKL